MKTEEIMEKYLNEKKPIPDLDIKNAVKDLTDEIEIEIEGKISDWFDDNQQILPSDRAKIINLFIKNINWNRVIRNSKV